MVSQCLPETAEHFLSFSRGFKSKAIYSTLLQERFSWSNLTFKCPAQGYGDDSVLLLTLSQRA